MGHAVFSLAQYNNSVFEEAKAERDRHFTESHQVLLTPNPVYFFYTATVLRLCNLSFHTHKKKMYGRSGSNQGNC